LHDKPFLFDVFYKIGGAAYQTFDGAALMHIPLFVSYPVEPKAIEKSTYR
jgi:hypothetical protein